MSADLFQNLFIFEIANNHQGNLQHGLNLIRSLGQIARQEDIKAAVKFQFRHLPSFLSASHHRHPSAMARRFLSTALAEEDFKILHDAVKKEGMLAMCTPFDEISAERVKAMGFDIVKVASCSATDLPLLRKISKLRLPTVASTAGISFQQVAEMVKILGNERPLAIMHCVALYPSENHELRLDRIAELRARFPGRSVGFSTHERPDNLFAVQLAYAQGARLFEKHVGLATEEIGLNAYSASPEQLTAWIQAWKLAKAACNQDASNPELAREANALRELKRACFAARPLKRGERIVARDISLSLSLHADQLLIDDFREGTLASRDYEAGDPLLRDENFSPHLAQLRNLLRAARLEVPSDLTIEVSHHYGMGRFMENGAFIVPVKGESLRKFLVLLAGQEHPIHFHEKKNETFHVLHGMVRLEIDGRTTLLRRGDRILVAKGCWHRFSSPDGAVIEETADVSTLDSVYQDEEIQLSTRQARKTFVSLKPAVIA